jgi:hypothetical protein
MFVPLKAHFAKEFDFIIIYEKLFIFDVLL